MNPPLLSRYLLPSSHISRPSLRTQLRMAMWQRPKIRLRTARHLALWSLILVCTGTASTSYVAGDQFSPIASVADVVASDVNAASVNPSVSGVTRLPGGPIGQLMPPGTLAPMGTYANRYAAGNCTWYAASRRPVPTNWGNARTWLPRARAAGWSVGAIPAIGAIAWTDKGSLGHVAVVEAVDGANVSIAEMNYTGYNRVSRRTVPASSFQYIY